MSLALIVVGPLSFRVFVLAFRFPGDLSCGCAKPFFVQPVRKRISQLLQTREMSSVLPAFRPSKSASMQYFRRMVFSELFFFRRNPEMSEGCASRLRGRGPLAGSRGRYLSSESGS